MFTVNTTWDIKMSIGDNVQFPLFINKGTRSNMIRYEFEENDGCEIYFYLIDPDDYTNDYILKKTFTSNGNIITEKPNQESTILSDVVNINDKKDFVIRLESSDTNTLKPKNYIYQVKAKVLSNKIDNKNLVIDEDSEYLILTVTNKYNFYLLDDNYNRAW